MISPAWLETDGNSFPEDQEIVNVLNLPNRFVTQAKFKWVGNTPMWAFNGRNLSFTNFTHWTPIPEWRNTAAVKVVEMPKLGPWKGPITIDRKAA